MNRPVRRLGWKAVLASAAPWLNGCGVLVASLVSHDAFPPGHYDPVFHRPTPLLFAHRGGAKEAPESTLMGFCHAIHHAKADVLELDVQLTRDKQFVVWHGPGLDNVLIADQPTNSCERGRRKIDEFDWDELEDQAWVADPLDDPPCCRDLRHVPRVRDRQLILLSDFLNRFRCTPLNIELKGTVRSCDVGRFVRILQRAPACEHTHGAPRPILVVSASETLLDAFRQYSCCMPTGLSALGNLSVVGRSIFTALPANMVGRSLQTDYVFVLDVCPHNRVVEQVHDDGGAVHVFISHFPLLGSLDDDVTASAADIRTLLDSDADGIMTDRPTEVRQLINAWKTEKQVLADGEPQQPEVHNGPCPACPFDDSAMH